MQYTISFTNQPTDASDTMFVFQKMVGPFSDAFSEAWNASGIHQRQLNHNLPSQTFHFDAADIGKYSGLPPTRTGDAASIGINDQWQQRFDFSASINAAISPAITPYPLHDPTAKVGVGAATFGPSLPSLKSAK